MEAEGIFQRQIKQTPETALGLIYMRISHIRELICLTRKRGNTGVSILIQGP
jgi:hypothetical protein